MSARKLLDELESQGLLDDNIIADLRRQVEESQSRITAETIAKLLVDNGHLTKYQATRLVGEVTAGAEQLRTKKSSARAKKRQKEKTIPRAGEDSELGLAEDAEGGASPLEQAGLSPLEASGLQPVPTQPVPTQPAPTQPAPTQPAAGQPVPSQPVPNQPVPNQPVPNQPVPNQPVPNQPVPNQPVAEQSGLQPLNGGGLQPIQQQSGLQPIQQQQQSGLQPLHRQPASGLEPSGGGDPFSGEGEELAEPEGKKKKKGLKKKRMRENVWDSPVLLICFGLILVGLLAGGFLYMSLKRGTAEEMFAAGEKDYKDGSYTMAQEKYAKFQKNNPKDPNFSLATVRLGMCRLRQTFSSSSDPQKMLDIAREVLPKIKVEEAFSEARPELATMLPTMARKFAEKADDASDIEKAGQLLERTNEALEEFVTNPDYLSSTTQKEQAKVIEGIRQLYSKVDEEIGREKRLVEAVEEIGKKVASGDTAAAYTVRSALLERYPRLETNDTLLAAVRSITDREKSLVGKMEVGRQPDSDEADDGVLRVLLQAHGGRLLPGAEKQQTLVRVDGCVYALKAGTGEVQWRRVVGFDTQIDPVSLSSQPGADVLAVDGRTHDLLRLSAADGSIVWRLPLGEPINAPVLSADEARIVVSTAGGMVFEVAADTGIPSPGARIPQSLTVGPAVGDARRPLIYQPADHDNLYVLSNDTLECQEVVFLQHKEGTIDVPPSMAVGHLFVAVNAFPGRCRLYVFKSDESGLNLKLAQPPIELKGHVIQPMVPNGRRIAVITDLGEVSVFAIAPQKKNQAPVTPAVKTRPATFSQAAISFAALDNTQMWVGSNRLTRYDLNIPKMELQQADLENQGDVFVAPLHRVPEAIIHTRRPAGSPGVTVRAVEDKKIKETIWHSELSVPAADVVIDEAGIRVVSARGRVYPITPEQVQLGLAPPNRPVDSSGVDQQRLYEHVANLPEGKRAFFTLKGEMQVYEPSSGQLVERSVSGGGPLAAPPESFGKGVVLPLKSGQLAWIASTGSPLAHSFQPRLAAGETLNWGRPAVVDDQSLVISDGRQSLYLVNVVSRGETHLAAAKQQSLNEEVESDLGVAGDTVYAIVRGAKSDILVSYRLPELATGGRRVLKGRVTFGPRQVGDRVFLATTEEGLLCLGPGDKELWKRPFPGRLLGPPVVDGKSYLVAALDGAVLRLEQDSGETTQRRDFGEPLSAGPAPFGPRVMVAGADGTLLAAPLTDVASASPVEAESSSGTPPPAKAEAEAKSSTAGGT